MSDRMMCAKTSYDRRADTFYFSVRPEKQIRYSEDDDGLIWRFDPRGDLVGVTVQAYERLWCARRSLLIEKIAESFHLEASAVARRLPAASSSPKGNGPSAYA